MFRVPIRNGANLNAYSMYNKNAFDLARDEFDAAENVVIDKSDIRAVMAEFIITVLKKVKYLEQLLLMLF